MNEISPRLPARAAGEPGRPAGAFRSVGLSAAAAILVVAAGPFVLDTYTISILVRAFLYAIVAITVDILWGYTGILTFGQSAFFGVGAYAAALTFTHLGFTPGTVALAFALAAVVPALLGLFVGWLSFYTGSTPLYASVVSLALPIVVSQVIFSGGTFTGSSSGLVGYDSFDIDTETWFWIVGGALVATAAAAAVLLRSETGRLLLAIRDNEMRCAYLGIDAARVKILLTAALAAVAGLAGLGYASFSGVVAPEIAGFVFGTQLVIYVALGGRGTLVGPIAGAIGIEVASAYLSGDLPYVWTLIVGLVFIVVIVALPKGFAPVVAAVLARLRPGRRLADAPKHRLPILAAAERQGEAPASLEIMGVAKSFGSLTVLDGIDLRVAGGELVSLVGPNGAGKTTLMRCISDGAERNAGTIRIGAHEIGRSAPQRIVGFGLGRKFQTASIFESLTIGECLGIARAGVTRPSLWRPLRALALPSAARAVLETTGLADALDQPARHLSHGQKQALELAMVLALEPRIVLLDEPTAGLTKVDRTRIGTILTELAGTHGLAIILVEHDLEFVRDISSRVVVLHQGRLLLDGSVADIVSSDLVAAIYAGTGHA